MKDWIRKGTEELRVRQHGETVVLSWKALEKIPFVRQCFSTRQGGVSEGFLSTMNFSFDRGDDPDHVRENYRRIAETIGVPADSFVVAHQTHTTNILVVGKEDRGTGVLRPRPYDDIDGLMTNAPGVTLVTYHADCIPVWLVDPSGKAAALLHAGWKGTVDGIAPKAVGMMRELYGADPEDLIACAGPGICSSCYEIGEDVADQFRGLRPENIHISDICTRCNAERLFSHRAHGVRRGLNAAFLGIFPEGD